MPVLEVGAAISYGWKKFTENVGPFVILMLAVLVAAVLVGLVQSFLSPSQGGLVALAWSALLSAVAYVVMSIVQAGVWRAGLGVTRGVKPEVSQLTETTNIVPFIITNILVGIGFFIGFLICILPGIVWLLFTAYAPLLALDKGLEPVDAIKTSIDWVKNNFGSVFLVLVGAYVVYLVGACLCGIGLLVSAPVGLVAVVYSYRALNHETVVA